MRKSSLLVDLGGRMSGEENGDKIPFEPREVRSRKA